MLRIGVILGLLALASVAQADDRPAIFAAQVQPLARLATSTEGLARCGIRSKRWSEKLQIAITIGVVKLADRLWPNGPTDDDESVAHDNALWEAYHAVDEAAERGRHVSPKWCVEVGSSPVPSTLDTLVAGSE